MTLQNASSLVAYKAGTITHPTEGIVECTCGAKVSEDGRGGPADPAVGALAPEK